MKHEHINALVSAREAKEKADVAYQEYLDKHPEFKAAETVRKEANKAVKVAEGKAHNAAYEWALKHGLIFLDVNSDRIEKALLTGIISEDMVDMFAYDISDRPTITIAKDLKAVDLKAVEVKDHDNS